LGGSQPLIARLALRTMESFRDSIGRSEALDRKSVDVESFVVEDWLCHLHPFEQDSVALSMSTVALSTSTGKNHSDARTMI
jgi:hypothetical protein